MATKSKARNIADFRAIYDKNVVVPARITAALADMAKIDAEMWCNEGPGPDDDPGMLKRASVSVTDLSMFREQFKDHVVDITTSKSTGAPNSRRVWFATAKAAKAARG